MLKNKISKLSAFITTTLVCNPVMAQTDPFGALTNKGNELIGIMQGTLATVILTLVIIGSALGYLFGKLQWQMALKIIVGAVIVASAGELAVFILNKN